MPKPTTILDRISITSPCSADWNSMTGNERVRFCLHCSKQVNNISEMTSKQAIELVSRSKGRLCLRYQRRPGGQIRTAEQPPRLHQIRRRASRLATGAFTAALSLCSSVVAQTRTVADEPRAGSVAVIEQPDSSCPARPDLANNSLAGTVLDPNGAVMPGATVTLVNSGTGLEQKVVSDDAGRYRFESLEAGTYRLKAELENFQSDERSDVVLLPGEGRELDLSLSVKIETATVGIVAVMAVPDDPLVKAAFENDLATVKHLIAIGVEVDKRDESTDTTALDEAVKYGNREMVRALLDAGAAINSRSSRQQSALMRLDDDATEELVWDLVSAGAKINLKDEDGDTALILAASYGNTEVLRALLDAGARINARNKAGETALMKATMEGNTEHVKLLIDFGANLGMRNSDGKTARNLAEDYKQSEVLELLEAYSAPK